MRVGKSCSFNLSNRCDNLHCFLGTIDYIPALIHHDFVFRVEHKFYRAGRHFPRLLYTSGLPDIRKLYSLDSYSLTSDHRECKKFIKFCIWQLCFSRPLWHSSIDERTHLYKQWMVAAVAAISDVYKLPRANRRPLLTYHSMHESALLRVLQRIQITTETERSGEIPRKSYFPTWHAKSAAAAAKSSA
jgi:hypothetical protein